MSKSSTESSTTSSTHLLHSRFLNYFITENNKLHDFTIVSRINVTFSSSKRKKHHTNIHTQEVKHQINSINYWEKLLLSSSKTCRNKKLWNLEEAQNLCVPMCYAQHSRKRKTHKKRNLIFKKHYSNFMSQSEANYASFHHPLYVHTHTNCFPCCFHFNPHFFLHIFFFPLHPFQKL